MSRKPSKPNPRLVWRITESAPMGEWVDPSKPRRVDASSTHDPREAASSGWMVSSFDLQRGADVSDDPDALPPELYDELFPPDRTKESGSGGH